MKVFKLIPYILIAFLLFRVIYLNKQNTVLIDKNATLEENLKRNKNRVRKVPEDVIFDLLSKLNIPEGFEAEEVEWKVV